MITTHPIPDAYDIDVHDAGQIQTYLEGRGHTISSVTVTHDSVLIETPAPYPISTSSVSLTDVTNELNGFANGDQVVIGLHLAEFVPPQSPKEQALAALNEIDLSTADVVQLQAAVGLLRALLNGDTTA